MIPSRSDYLHTEVTTAAPQKLHLMLIEAALRSAGQARQHWAQQQDAAACLALIRSQDILTEMLAILRPNSDDPLVRQVTSLYMFVYQSLVSANLERSQSHLDAAVSVLEVERETWRQLCERLGSHESHGPHWSTAGTASFVA